MKKEISKDYKNSNLGWLYYKGYYDGLNAISPSNKTFVKCANSKEEKLRIKKYFDLKNEAVIKASNVQGTRPSSLCADLKDYKLRKFELETTYPGLITGSGISHEIGKIGESKLGLQFDYTSGLPCILGSSVKGLLRSMFPEDENDESRIEYIKSICEEILEDKAEKQELEDANIVELGKAIFDGLGVSKRNSDTENKYLSTGERDVFFDASVCHIKKDLLGLDNITPHKEILKNPNPITFMKIMPGVTIEFVFKLFDIEFDNGVKFTGDDKLKLFERILLDVGIGAKTNVGYGQFISKT